MQERNYISRKSKISTYIKKCTDFIKVFFLFNASKTTFHISTSSYNIFTRLDHVISGSSIGREEKKVSFKIRRFT